MSLEDESIKKAKETSLSSTVQGAVSAMQRKCVLIKKPSHRYVQIRRLRSRSDKRVKRETLLQMRTTPVPAHCGAEHPSK